MENHVGAGEDLASQRWVMHGVSPCEWPHQCETSLLRVRAFPSAQKTSGGHARKASWQLSKHTLRRDGGRRLRFLS